MIQNQFTFNIYKTDFFGQYFEAKNTKAVLILVHGMGEHSSRYIDFVIPTLLKNNFSVVTFDQFGHGRTSGKRGHNPSFEAVLESVSKVIEKATTLFPKKPIFLYGHSMGGNVVINYALRKETTLKGIVASSPFLKLAFQPPNWKLSLGKILQKIAPSITMSNEINPDYLSRNKTEVEKYKNDPLVHDKISPNYSLTFIETGKWAIENAHKLKIPALLLHGTSDKIIDFKGTEAFSKNTEFATLKRYKDGYHELHTDLCKEEFMEYIIVWLNSEL